MVDLYPILTTPIYKEMVWGGNKLHNLFKRELPYEKTGESWEISCRPDAMSVIANGSAKGLTLEEYINQDRAAVLGTRLMDRPDFPLLVKLIDANEALSVQVHPDDELAKTLGPSASGKSEMWYIIAPPADGHLIIGLHDDTTPESLKKAIENGTVEKCINRLKVEEGDIVDIPAGLVHALTPGAVILEVQQNSDTTYRLYDYNRIGLNGKPRELHIDEAMAAIDFEGKIPKAIATGVERTVADTTINYKIVNEHFAVAEYKIESTHTEKTSPEAFSIFTCVNGAAQLEAKSGGVVRLELGQSVFLPAGLGAYVIKAIGDMYCTLIKSFVPNQND